MRQRRKSRGEKDEDSDDEAPQEDPKIQREIEELSKFKDTSGIGKIIYKELAERKAQPMKLLDPWKASRVPGADHEPKYCTRYQSPMFACKFRSLLCGYMDFYMYLFVNTPFETFIFSKNLNQLVAMQFYRQS